jgi:hypothetical protein
MQNITSFEIACQVKGIPTTLPDVSSWPAAFRRPLLAFYKLTVIRDAIVGKWVPDWNNGDQCKWFPLFWMNKPGFRFGVSSCALTASIAPGGPRLWFETEEQTLYAATTFLSLWEEWMTMMPADAHDAQQIAKDATDKLKEMSEEIAIDLSRWKEIIRPTRKLTKELALEAAIQSAGNHPKIKILDEAKKIHEWLIGA